MTVFAVLLSHASPVTRPELVEPERFDRAASAGVAGHEMAKAVGVRYTVCRQADDGGWLTRWGQPVEAALADLDSRDSHAAWSRWWR